MACVDILFSMTLARALLRSFGGRPPPSEVFHLVSGAVTDLLFLGFVHRLSEEPRFDVQ